MKAGIIGTACLTAAASSPSVFAFTTDQIEAKRTDLFFRTLPQAFDGYKIALIADVHFGPFVPDLWLEEAIAKVKEAEVDLLLLGGDYINIPETLISACFGVNRNPALSGPASDRLAGKIFKRFCEIISVVQPRDGVLAVYGNHDRWVARKACAREFTRSGIKLLVNQSAVISRETEQIEIVGFDDYWTGIPQTSILAGLDESAFRIILAHNPDFISDLIEKTEYYFSLALAGHTHGGQIKFPLTGALMHNIRDARFCEGLYQHPRGPVYTTRGIGTVEIPYRVNCPAEVTILVIHRRSED